MFVILKLSKNGMYFKIGSRFCIVEVVYDICFVVEGGFVY